MVKLQFLIVLRVMGRGEDMGGLPEPDELLELPGDELRPVVGNDLGVRQGTSGSTVRAAFMSLGSNALVTAATFSGVMRSCSCHTSVTRTSSLTAAV